MPPGGVEKPPWRSKKAWAAAVGVALVVLNRILKLGMSPEEVMSLAGMVSSYVMGQGYVDAKVRSAGLIQTTREVKTMAGIKESKELLAALAKLAGVFADSLKDGFQLTDLTVLMAMYADPEVQAAIQGIDQVKGELGDLKPSEIARLLEAAAGEAAVELEARESQPE